MEIKNIYLINISFNMNMILILLYSNHESKNVILLDTICLNMWGLQIGKSEKILDLIDQNPFGTDEQCNVRCIF